MRLQPSAEQLLQLTNKMGAAVIVIEEESKKILYVNEHVCQDLKLEQGDIINQSYEQIFWPEFLDFFENFLKKRTDDKSHSTVYYWTERLIWEQLSCQNIKWHGDQSAVLVTITNITEAIRLDSKYERIMYFDGSLELPNGKKLEEDIKQFATLENVILLYLEIERFEEINHLFGFDAGDQLLANIKNWILNTESKRSQLYAIDKGFVLLGKDVTFKDVEIRAKEIHQRFKNTWEIRMGKSSYSLFCSAKIGVISGKYLKNEMRNVLLRTAKSSNNPKGYAVYDEKTDLDAKNALLLRQTLINCVQNGMTGFEVYFQPIVQAGSHKWRGAESLCRWTTPEGKQVQPLEFIHMAEQLGLIGTLDNWVRETAINTCVQWGAHKRDFFLDMNFSPKQTLNDAFIDHFTKLLQKAGRPSLKVSLEITESTKMIFSDVNLKGIQKLKEKGVALSLDDFGTGYSSLENLIKLSPNTIKTEKILLDGIEEDSERKYLLKVLIDMAHHFNMKVIAEGVETEAQRKILEAFGADFMQGYLFSKPIPSIQMKKELWRFEKY